MRVAVIGASGTIGKAICELLSREGMEVIKASRSTSPRIQIENPASVESFYQEVGELDAVICAAGNPAFGPLNELSDEQIQESFASKLAGQIFVVRKGLDKINPGGIFILTGGTLAHQPWPGTSMAAMVNAALEGFARAAALDLTENRRIITIHPPLVKETAPMFGIDDSPWPPAATVAQTYLDALKSEQTGVPLFVKGYEVKA